MTSLLSWIGVDQRGPSSLYLVADSRITWFDGSQWDHGRKVFASKMFPEIFGYCGDAFFPTHVLSQIVDTIDLGLMLDLGHQTLAKLDRLNAVLTRSLSQYPTTNVFKFDLLYGTREGEGMNSRFRVFQMSFQHDRPVAISEFAMPDRSEMLVALGSGRSVVLSHISKWQVSEAKETSRAVFAAFCDAVHSGEDPKSGGMPQFAVIHRKGGAQICGFVDGISRGICGVELTPPESGGGIAWFNNLFEICDGTTGQRRVGTQQQPKPKK